MYRNFEVPFPLSYVNGNGPYTRSALLTLRGPPLCLGVNECCSFKKSPADGCSVSVFAVTVIAAMNNHVDVILYFCPCIPGTDSRK